MKDPEIAAIERAMADDPNLEDLLRILLKLTNITRQGEGSPGGADFIPDGGRLAEGFPLADTRLLANDLERLHDRFSRVVGVVLEKDPKGIDEVVRSYSDREVFRSLLAGVLTQEYRFPETFTGSQPVTLLAANETLLPLLTPIREEAQRRNLLGDWTASYCPVCGAAAHLSLIEGDEGRLFLSCGRCLTRWKFRRLTCAFCGESKPRNVRYFTAESDAIHRVYVCDSCKHYIKSVDLREKETVFGRLEDLMTIRLDLVARREGYVRDSVDLVSILAMGE